MKKLTRERVVPIYCGESLLSDLGNERLYFAGLAKLGHQQQDKGEALFTVVEELIDKVCLSTHPTGEQKCEEQFGKSRLLVQYANYSSFRTPNGNAAP